MKKLSLLIAAILILSVFVIPVAVQAEEDKIDYENNIEIAFAIGESVLSINGKKVEVAKPYVVDGVTLVPVRVITEAFGADVSWDEATQTASVEYGDVIIKLTIGNKTAIVNGSATEMMSAPELMNGSTMLPLRFLTESFGADVAYDEETEKIKVTKEITQSNSIKDYALILKRSVKDKVGDSFYNWSMKRTSELKLKQRSFDGYSNYFSSGSRDASVSVRIELPEKDSDIDDYMEDFKEISKDYTTIEYRKAKTPSGIPYAHIQFKSTEGYFDYRTYVTAERLYLVSTSIDVSEGLKGFKEMCDIADTFDLVFHKNVAEDLSDVGIDNMHTFDSKNMKIKIAIPGDFLEFNDEDTDNEFEFIRYKDRETAPGGRINIEIFSSYEDRKYDDLAKNDFELNKRMSNPEKSVFSEITSMVVDTKNALVYDSTVQYDDQTMYAKDIFVDCGKYLYNISVSVPDDEASRILMDKIIASIEIGEIDEEEVGRIIRTAGFEEVKYKKISNESFGYSLESPINWEVNDSSANTYSLFDNDSARAVSIIATSMQDMRGLNVYDISNAIIKSLESQKNVTMLENNPSTTKKYGREMRLISFKQKMDSSTNRVNIYVFVRDKVLYQIMTICPDYLYGEDTKTKFEYILSSFTFK